MKGLRQQLMSGGSLLGPAAAGALLAASLLVAPGAADAFSSGFDSRPVSLAARGAIGSFTPASVDPRLAAQLSVKTLSQGRLFRFTPAGSSTRPDRSVTVAVRVNEDAARAVSVRNVLASTANAPGAAPVRVAPTAFNLGMARGFDSFAQKLAAPAETRKIDGVSKIDMPDLASYEPGRKSEDGGKPARFAPRITVDENATPGRAPRTLEGQDSYSVEVGGSYRVTGNVAVTAGVRYGNEPHRIAPLTDATQDSQAVYVGTQFRF